VFLRVYTYSHSDGSVLERHNSLLVLTQITFVQPASSSQISNTMAQLFFHSYDDTELEQALSIYERPEGFFQIIGNIGEPITIGPRGILKPCLRMRRS
jgi:hypothetical protein